MKKVSTLVLMLVVCLIVTGCGSKASGDKEKLPRYSDGYEKICSMTETDEDGEITTYVGLKDSTSSVTRDMLYVYTLGENLDSSKKTQLVDTIKSGLQSEGCISSDAYIEGNKLYATCENASLVETLNDMEKSLKDDGYKCE